MQNQTFICRRCKVSPQATIVNRRVTSVTCPSCGVSLKGNAARRMIDNQSVHFMQKEFQNVLRRSFSKSRSSGTTLSYRPTRLRRPSGPFIIGKAKR